MNVLSLFDGMSCGQIALGRVGVTVDNYFASEIDKYAIKVTQKNYPETKQIGTVTDVYGKDLPKIDLLMGGSPCQGFSLAGKQLNFNDPRSALFFDFVRLLKETSPKYFLLENVKMKKEYQDIISGMVGVQPIEINSAIVSAQNRKRLYWTNIPNVEQPEDKGILLKDVVHETEFEAVLKNHGKYRSKNNKANCIDANYFKGVDNHGQRTQILAKGCIRKLTPVECERLQTVPDNYTDGVSNTQRYKMLGNGWTVDVISHILKNIM